jgi:hypothetical protein
MSHGPALQRRHLPERPEQAGGAHEHEPPEQPEPEVARVVVGRELRREAVERVREAGGNGHDEARAARGATQAERQESEDGENGERHPEARALGVRRVARRGRDREERHASGHGQSGDDLAPSDVLVELAHRDDEEEDERRPEHGLHEGERRLRQRVRLADPADDPEGRPGDPARPPHEAGEEREAKRSLGRLLPRLERLQAHPDREHRRGAERGKNADQKRRHDRCGR